MELTFLYFLQSMHTDFMDGFMASVTKLGDAGIFWVILGIVLICFKKTRRCGIFVILSMLLCLVIGNGILKNLFARQRPFQADPSISLLVEKPWDYSFPSGHTMHSFAAAVTVFLFYRKAGAAALLLAALIAFSRMYLFLHYPSDIIGGLVIGIAAACFVYDTGGWLQNKKERKRQQKSGI